MHNYRAISKTLYINFLLTLTCKAEAGLKIMKFKSNQVQFLNNVFKKPFKT